MLSELKELWRYRELLLVMVQRDLKIRYKNSALGFFWSFLNPLLTVGVMTFVYGQFIFKNQPNMGAYIMAGYLPFMFFQMCLLDSAQSVLSALPIIKKIYFPREILPLAAVISNFINFSLAMAIFFVYLLINFALHPGDFPIKGTVVLVPLLMLFSLALSAGASLIVSALNTFYEDVKYIVGVLLYLLFFLCPVVYFDETVANSKINIASGWLVYKLYNLNPIAQLCTAYKKSILAPYNPLIMEPSGQVDIVKVGPIDLSWKYLSVAGFASFAILIFGYWLFNRMKWKFVERP